MSLVTILYISLAVVNKGYDELKEKLESTVLNAFATFQKMWSKLKAVKLFCSFALRLVLMRVPVKIRTYTYLLSHHLSVIRSCLMF